MSITVMDVAYHEAGHAVAGALLGATIERVMIEDDSETIAGMCLWNPDALSTEDFIAAVYSGALAVALRTGRVVPIQGTDKSELIREARMIPGVSSSLSDGQVLKLVLGMDWRARKLLTANWRAVASLAGRLYRERSVDGADVHALLGS